MLDEETRNYLPGGTATISVNTCSRRVEKDIEDDEQLGRWSGSTYQLGNNKRLNVITAYRVIDQPITTNNSKSTSSQQFHRLRERGTNTIKPRRKFTMDFITQVEEK
jgi:hypothetical protein